MSNELNPKTHKTPIKFLGIPLAETLPAWTERDRYNARGEEAFGPPKFYREEAG